MSKKQMAKMFIFFKFFTTISIIGGVATYCWAGEPIVVFVSIAPQKQIVQHIGKEFVDVQVLVPPGADPHTYEPKPRQMVAISKARLYVAVGVAFEKAKLEKIVATNRHIKVIHTDEGIPKIPMIVRHHHHGDRNRHSGGETGTDHHADDGLDPHIWLSPPLVKAQL